MGFLCKQRTGSRSLLFSFFYVGDGGDGGNDDVDDFNGGIGIGFQ